MFYLGSGRLDRTKHRNQTTGLLLTFSSLVLVFQPRISSSYHRFMLIISSHIIYFNASCPQKHKYNSMLTVTVTVTEQMYSMCSVDRLFLLPPSDKIIRYRRFVINLTANKSHTLAYQEAQVSHRLLTSV